MTVPGRPLLFSSSLNGPVFDGYLLILIPSKNKTKQKTKDK